MLINKIEIMNSAEIDMNGDIYFEKKKDTVIKLGEFKFDKKYGHLTINLGNVCRIEYEHYQDTEVLGDMDFKYWFKSQFICDRFHGRPTPDHEWVVDMFNDVTVYTEEINNLIIIMIKKLFAKCDSFNAGTHNKEVA